MSAVRFTLSEIAGARLKLEESESAILDANMCCDPPHVVVNEETESILKKLGKLTADNSPSANTDNLLSQEPHSKERQQKRSLFESHSEQKEIKEALSGFEPYPD